MNAKPEYAVMVLRREVKGARAGRFEVALSEMITYAAGCTVGATNAKGLRRSIYSEGIGDRETVITRQGVAGVELDAMVCGQLREQKRTNEIWNWKLECGGGCGESQVILAFG